MPTRGPLIRVRRSISDGAPRRRVAVLLAVCLAMQSVALCSRALAETVASQPIDEERIDAEPVDAETIIDDEPWEFIVTPYLWATYMDGSSTAGGETSNVDVNASDILRGLNFAFMGQLTARKGRWGVFVNAVYANLDGSQSIGLTSVSATIEQTLLDFAVFYRVGDWRDLQGEGLMPVSGFLDLYGGARYMNLGLDLDLRLPRRGPGGNVESVINLTGHGSKSWIDPIVGFRTRWNLTERWNVALQADIGGGANADLTWQAQLIAGYRFGLFADDDANWLLGYRAIYEKYQDGQGDRKFALNATTHGPVFGLAIRF